jgi:hypothetical protein
MREEFSCVAIVADSVTTSGVESKIGDVWEPSRSNRVRIILPTFQMLVQDAVALASSVFQAGAVFYLHVAALIRNETRFLQDARGDGDARAACTQHH